MKFWKIQVGICSQKWQTNKERWQCGGCCECCQPEGFSRLHMSGTMGVVFTQQASIAVKVGKQMMSKQGLVHMFQAHLIPSEAVNHGNARAIRPSWLMGAISIKLARRHSPIICADASTCNLCNTKSLNATTLKKHMRSEMGWLMVTYPPISA